MDSEPAEVVGNGVLGDGNDPGREMTLKAKEG